MKSLLSLNLYAKGADAFLVYFNLPFCDAIIFFAAIKMTGFVAGIAMLSFFTFKIFDV